MYLFRLFIVVLISSLFSFYFPLFIQFVIILMLTLFTIVKYLFNINNTSNLISLTNYNIYIFIGFLIGNTFYLSFIKIPF
jgi:hypothetical protein